MDLLNQKVTHTKFGTGTIIDQQDKMVTVKFQKEEKKFVYPEGFGNFLKLVDSESENIMNAVISKKKDIEQQELSKVLSEIRERKEARPSAAALAQANKCNVAVKKDKIEDFGDEWKVYAGRVLSGVKKGTAMNFRGVTTNNLVMLTTREDKTEEKDRFVFAAFIVKNHAEGNDETEGYLEANPEYRISLTPEEARQVKFWEFYFNEKKPEVVRMGSGQHRYFTDMQAAQVLKKILEVKETEEGKEQVQKVLSYFLNNKNIGQDEISEPSGAITRA